MIRGLRDYEGVIDCEGCGTGIIVDKTNSDGVKPFYPYERFCGSCTSFLNTRFALKKV